MTKSRIQLLSLLAVFVLPLAVALALQWSGWRPASVERHGHLFDQAIDVNPVKIRTVAGKEAAWQNADGLWRVLFVAPAQCGTECERALDQLYRVWLALGKHARRIEVFYYGRPEGASARYGKFFRRMQFVAAAEESVDPLSPMRQPAYSVQLIDPHGYWIMQYAPGFDPDGLRADLVRLLKSG